MIGSRIGQYQIIELLGEGGMGTVYRARDILLDREVAVKMLHQHLRGDHVFLSRFKNEALLSAKINHPNVTTLFQFLEADGRQYLIMEYVSGRNLEKIIKSFGSLSVKSVVPILIQLVEGLKNAHQKGIIHRDIKPGNIMVSDDGYVKLMDFGIARIEESIRLTRVNHVIGTTAYLAPELLEGGNPSVASDLYAVGVVAFEMLFGHLPNAGSNSSGRQRILEIPSIQSLFSSGDQAKLIRIVKRLLHKNPGRRHESAQSLLDDLSALGNYGRIKLESSPAVINHKVNKSVKEVSDKIAGLLRKSFSGHFDRLWHSTEGKIITISLLVAIPIFLGGLIWPAVNPKYEPEDDNEPETAFMEITSQEEIIPLNRVDSSQWTEIQTEKKSPVQPVDNEEKNVPQKTPEPSTVTDSKPPPLNAVPVQEKKSEEKTEQSGEEISENDTGNTLSSRPDSTDVNSTSEPANPGTEDEPSGTIVQDEKKVETVSLLVPELEISAVFSKDISSDRNQKNEIFFLENQIPVYTNGHLLIASGARIKAVIREARSSQTRAKAFLAIQVQSVEAVNGDWVSLQYPIYSDKGAAEIIFRRGTQLRRLRLKPQMLNIQIQQ